jgi:hypothetical protein
MKLQNRRGESWLPSEISAGKHTSRKVPKRDFLTVAIENKSQMIWPALICGSTWFGYEILSVASSTARLRFFSRILSGWLLGSILTGFALFFTSYFSPITFTHSLILTITLISISLVLRIFLHRPSPWDRFTPWFLFFLIATSGIALKYLSSIYGGFPSYGPGLMLPILNTESSFINSVLHGCNLHRSDPFLFNNPLLHNQPFHGYPAPLLFTAACISLGGSFTDVSIVIHFLNAIATAYTIFVLSAEFTPWPTVSSLLYLFSGSWAAYLYCRALNRPAIGNDLVRQFQPSHLSIWYQPFGCLLAMSKSSSFAIALAHFAIFFRPSWVGSLFASLIPSAATSFAAFGFLAGVPGALKSVLPFSLTLGLRLRPFLYFLRPLFREAEMRGTYFAPFVIWFLALGPVFLVLFFLGWSLPEWKLRSCLFAAAGPFLILQFVREGIDHFANATAVTAVVLPFAMIYFTELLHRFIHKIEDLEYRGLVRFFATGTIAFLLAGGAICLTRIVRNEVQYMSDGDHEFVKWAMEKIPPDAVFLTKAKPFHPLSLAGRRQFLGDPQLLWRCGFNISAALDEFDTLAATAINADWVRLGVAYYIAETGFKVRVAARQVGQFKDYRVFRIVQ